MWTVHQMFLYTQAYTDVAKGGGSQEGHGPPVDRRVKKKGGE